MSADADREHPVDLLRIIRTARPAEAAAEVITQLLGEAIDARSRATLAVSGGSSPLAMFDELAATRLDWSRIHLLQVDERVAPDGHPDRNVEGLLAHLARPAGIPDDHVHRMQVGAGDAEGAAAAYRRVLADVAGSPPVVDVVHLGLGDDGHTASLAPGSPALGVPDDGPDVVATATYRGRARVTMTAPMINRARHRVWLVPSAGKATALSGLLDGTTTDPSGLIARAGSTLVTDLTSPAPPPSRAAS